MTRELAELCDRSTEFHFPSLQDQLDKIKVGRHETLFRYPIIYRIIYIYSSIYPPTHIFIHQTIQVDTRKAGVWREDFTKKRAQLEARLSGQPVDTTEYNKDFTKLQVSRNYNSVCLCLSRLSLSKSCIKIMWILIMYAWYTAGGISIAGWPQRTSSQLIQLTIYCNTYIVFFCFS